MTHDEATEECVASMGESLEKYYRALDIELMTLYAKWNEYIELFCNNKSRIDLLNRTAPGFFYIVQQFLWDDLILHVARFLDNPKDRGNKNIRLALKGLLDVIDNSTVQKHVGGLINKANKSAKFCRDWRHRRIAHRDLGLVMQEAKPLDKASIEGMRTALNSIEAVLNAVREHYLHSTIHYKTPTIHGALTLLRYLHLGVQKDRERRDRLNAGDYQPEDWANIDL